MVNERRNDIIIEILENDIYLTICRYIISRCRNNVENMKLYEKTYFYEITLGQCKNN